MIKFRVHVWLKGQSGAPAHDIPYAGLKGALKCAARWYRKESVSLVKVQNAITGHNIASYDFKKEA